MHDVHIWATVAGCYEAHKFVDSRLDAIGAKGPTRDHLFAIDPLSTGRIILRTKHQTAAMLGESRPLPTIVAEHHYDFCVRVSPVQRDHTGRHQSRCGKRRMPATDLMAWQRAHLGEDCGVNVQKVYMRSYRTFCTRGNGFFIPDVVMVGRLKVLDPNKVIHALQTGIGRHRAFGFGLLQLFPVEN